jgi:Methylamine utilisation protein MauE
VPMLDAAYTVVAAAGCAVLAWAGLEKARNRVPLAQTLAALGVPRVAASAAAVAVPLAELAAAGIVIAGGPGVVPAVLFTVLGLGFAAAGAVSLASGETVACACFGSSERTLGWPQLVALPFWLLAAWSVAHMPAFGLRDRAVTFAGGIVLLAATRAVPALRAAAGARSDRRALLGG